MGHVTRMCAPANVRRGHGEAKGSDAATRWPEAAWSSETHTLQEAPRARWPQGPPTLQHTCIFKSHSSASSPTILPPKVSTRSRSELPARDAAAARKSRPRCRPSTSTTTVESPELTKICIRRRVSRRRLRASRARPKKCELRYHHDGFSFECTGSVVNATPHAPQNAAHVRRQEKIQVPQARPGRCAATLLRTQPRGSGRARRGHERR